MVAMGDELRDHLFMPLRADFCLLRRCEHIDYNDDRGPAIAPTKLFHAGNPRPSTMEKDQTRQSSATAQFVSKEKGMLAMKVHVFRAAGYQTKIPTLTDNRC